jgi:sulfite exporter TauE/SafE/plastocyanin domain-containing protein
VLTLIASMFVLGLVTSVHCISMCGPMVVSYAVNGDERGPWHRRLIPNVAYQGSKIASYVAVGLVLGTIGSALGLDRARPYVMLVAGALMIVVGLGMTGRFPWAARLTPRPPKFLTSALSSIRRKGRADADAGQTTLATPITFGLLTGLMPCAPLMAAELAAAGTGNALSGGAAMLAFGVGTAPLMLAFGTASGLLRPDFKRRMISILAVVVVLLGVVYLDRAATRLGSPVSLSAAKQSIFGPAASTAAAASYAKGTDGVTEIPLTIRNTQFVPADLQIPADRPTRLIVDRQEDNPCSGQLAVPQLGITVDLTPNGVTTVDLPATKAGEYTLTCGMGMMSGRISAVAAPTAVSAAATAAAAPAAQSAPSSAAGACSCCAPITSQKTQGTAAGSAGVQKIAVDVSQGYNPNEIVLKAGVPAEITFGQSSGCTAVVQSKDLGFEEDLTTGPKTVKLQGLATGTYAFACGMDMVHGTIVVK